MPLRDQYCNRRWKVTKFLANNGVIRGFEIEEGFRLHRWEKRMLIAADRGAVSEVLADMQAEHEKRLSKTATVRRPAVTGLPTPPSAQPTLSKTAGVHKSAVTQGGKIFIGHGHSAVWRDLKDFLHDRLKLNWVEFNRDPVAGLSTKERLEQMLNQSAFAFLVMTAEDEYNDGTRHARENVIHEAGLFQGRLGFERAIILLEEGCAELPTSRVSVRYASRPTRSKQSSRKYAGSWSGRS